MQHKWAKWAQWAAQQCKADDAGWQQVPDAISPAMSTMSTTHHGRYETPVKGTALLSSHIDRGAPQNIESDRHARPEVGATQV